MPKIEDSIEVHVPVQQVYNQWPQFEEFPKFMDGILSVQQRDDMRIRRAHRFLGAPSTGRRCFHDRGPIGKSPRQTGR
jgi:uncharacterized membrane protein